MNTIDIFTHGIAFFIGIITVYFTAYTKAKGANRALKEDVQSLEKTKQEIISKHAEELESVKKEYQLEIEKRKFKYEDKRAQFSKFFKLIDEFNSKCNIALANRLPPMMHKLIEGQLSGCKETSNQSILNFNNQMMQLFSELNEEQLRVNHESNSIRLIATPQIDGLLDKLETDIKASYEDAVAMLNLMGTLEFIADNSIIVPHQEKLTKTAQRVLNSREALKKQMKLELDEI